MVKRENDSGCRGRYIKHNNLLPALLPFILIGAALILVIGVCQWKGLIPADTCMDKCALAFIYVMLTGIIIFFSVYGLYTRCWELWIDGEKIIHTNWRGKQAQYDFSDITRCVNKSDSFNVYSGGKRIFILELQEKDWFESRVRDLGIPVEYKHNQTLENHAVRVNYLILGFETAAGIFFAAVGAGIILENDSGFMAVPMFLLAAGAVLDAARLWGNRLEICGDTLFCYRFLRKKKEIGIKEITEIQLCGEKNKAGRQQYIFFSGKGMLFQFRISGYMTGTELFDRRMTQEKVKWKRDNCYGKRSIKKK